MLTRVDFAFLFTNKASRRKTDPQHFPAVRQAPTIESLARMTSAISHRGCLRLRCRHSTELASRGQVKLACNCPRPPRSHYVLKQRCRQRCRPSKSAHPWHVTPHMSHVIENPLPLPPCRSSRPNRLVYHKGLCVAILLAFFDDDKKTFFERSRRS